MIEDEVYKEPEIPSRLAILLSSVVSLVDKEPDKVLKLLSSVVCLEAIDADNALIELENEDEYCSAFNE